jgi:hypothetical protein
LGTSNLEFLSGSSWTAGSGSTRLNININAGAGTFTLIPGGSLLHNYATGTFTYTSGTVVTTGSTLGILTTTTLNTDGIIFDNIQVNQGVITLNSLLSASGTMSVASVSSPTFSGTHGFTVANFSCTVVNRNIVLKSGITYTVTTSLILQGTGIATAQNIRLLSTIASSYANLVVNQGATCLVKFVVATDIDSLTGGGMLIRNVKGTILRTQNWEITNPDYYSLFYN